MVLKTNILIHPKSQNLVILHNYLLCIMWLSNVPGSEPCMRSYCTENFTFCSLQDVSDNLWGQFLAMNARTFPDLPASVDGP